MAELREFMVRNFHEVAFNSSLVFGITFSSSFHVKWDLERLCPPEVRSWHRKLSRSCIFIISTIILSVLWKRTSILNNLIVFFDRLHVEFLRQVILNQLNHFIHQKLLKFVNHAPLSKICLFFALKLA